MGKNKEIIETIADALPEGLDESTVEKIAELVAVTIQEEVKEKVSELTNKVKFFIRGNVDKLKEQAVKELELENETFRNAQLFETVRSMFALENSAEDELNGLNAIASISEQTEEQNEILLGQVNKLLQENVKLKNQVKLVNDKNKKLEESLEVMQGDIESLRESKSERQLSDTAIIVSEESFKVKPAAEKLVENHAVTGNEWINQSVIAAQGKLNNLHGVK